MTFEPVAPRLERLCRATVEIAAPLVVGDTPRGLRRVIPITGGRVEGPRLRRFASLALALARHGIGKVLLVGAQDEREECDAIARACPDVAIDVCGQTAILDLVPLARAAHCVVANDTGTAHVAAVAERPMVVVCGPTDPRRVRPAGARVRTVQAELWCRNCYRKECSHHSCMDVLSPEQVLAALASLGAIASPRN
jgi:heptosyltransferase-2